MTTWTEDHVESQEGKVFVVTGANSGVGLHASKAFVRHGGHVVMACRNLERSKGALTAVGNSGPGSAELMQLDLADLNSVASFAADLVKKHPAINVLVNNAGVMGGPRESTAQGFEMQMGTNHLGHFALTAQVWPALKSTPGGRVISLSSLAARGGLLTPDMPLWLLTDPKPYSPFGVYSNTKQATLLFSQELARRVSDAKLPVASIAAHPGVSSTNLFNRQLTALHLGTLVPLTDALGAAAFQSPKSSARSEIRSATDPTIKNGDFVGPRSLGQSRGAPAVLTLFLAGRNPETAARLWQLSEEITNVTFEV